MTTDDRTWYEESNFDDFTNPTAIEEVTKRLELRDWQKKAKKYFFDNDGLALYEVSTGTGKCLKKGTEIIMFDGSIKKVEDVMIGDKLMGDDSTPRVVTSLASGNEMMYDVIPVKGDKYTVNESHILSLKYTNIHHQKKLKNGTIKKYISKRSGIKKDISVKDYLKLNKTEKHVLKGYRVGVEFKEKKIELDPYLLGLWLGDGSASSQKIHNPDKEIISYLKKSAKDFGLVLKNHNGKESKYRCPQLAITNGYKAQKNIFLDLLRRYELINNKHIPKQFLINSRKNRLKLLAGLLDTDGHLTNNTFEIIQKSDRLAKDILFLARSLGFAAYSTKKIGTIKKTNFKGIYNRIFISGNCYLIPTKIKRKQAKKRKQKKDVLVTGIKINPVGIKKYYGFTLSGNNRRFLLKDFTVVHNTFMTVDLIDTLLEKKPDMKVLVVVPKNVILETGWYKELVDYGLPIQKIGVYYGNIKEYAQITLTNIQSVDKIPLEMFDMLIADEIHNFATDRLFKIIEYPFRYKIGLTATLKRLDNKHYKIMKIFKYNIFKYSPEQALDDEVLNPFIFTNIGVHLDEDERYKYEELSDNITTILKTGGGFEKIIRSTSPLKFKLLALLNERKMIVNNFHLKFDIARKVMLKNKDKKIIVFNQFNSQTSKLYWHLLDDNIDCRVIHSGITNDVRDKALIDFRNDKFNVLLTSRVLDEGYNLPKLDVAIIMAGDSTDKQTIQRMGRVLRKKKGVTSMLYQIYCIKTIEESNSKKRADFFKGIAMDYKDITYDEYDEDFLE